VRRTPRNPFYEGVEPGSPEIHTIEADFAAFADPAQGGPRCIANVVYV
jgi:hypothetical protein